MITAPEDRTLGLAVVRTTLAILLSSVAGFGAQLLLASLVGPGARLDSFLAVTALPLTIVGISTTVLSAYVVPRLAADVWSPSSAAGVTVAVIRAAALVIAVGMLVSSISRTTTGLGGPTNPGTLAILAWSFAFISILVQLEVALLNARRSFTIPAASNILIPLFLALGIVLGAETGDVRPLLYGYVAGAISQFAILFALIRPHVLLRHRDPSEGAARFLIASLPVALAVLPSTGMGASDAFWSTSLAPGSLSYLALSTRLTVPIAAIATTGVATIVFPSLVSTAASHDTARFGDLLAKALLGAAAILVPCAAIGIALRGEWVRILLQHGAFTARNTTELAAILPYYCVGLVFTGFANILVRAFYATNEHRRLASLGLMVWLAYALASGGVVHTARGTEGIAACYLVAWASFAMLALFHLRSRLFADTRRRLAIGALVVGVSSALSFGVVSVLQPGVRSLSGGEIGVLGLALLALASLASYAGLVAAFWRSSLAQW